MQVLVRDNNIDQALRVLKKKMQREGVFREMRQRRSYEKPSERKNREKAEAIRRARKLARKKAQREGLLPDPRRKKLLEARALGQRPGTADRAAPRRPFDHRPEFDSPARPGPPSTAPALGANARSAWVRR